MGFFRGSAPSPAETERSRDRDPPGVLRGRAYVLDGDTIVVHGTHVRILHIDAPELGQVAHGPGPGGEGLGPAIDRGAAARHRLAGIIGRNEVSVVPRGTDKYGRVLGEVFAGGRDVGLMLVERGFAYVRKDAPEHYRRAEARARIERRGIWATADIMDPSLWRRTHSNSERGAARPARRFRASREHER